MAIDEEKLAKFTSIVQGKGSSLSRSLKRLGNAAQLQKQR